MLLHFSPCKYNHEVPELELDGVPENRPEAAESTTEVAESTAMNGKHCWSK